MASKFDKYLDQLPKKNKQILANINAKKVEQVAPPPAKSANKVSTSKPKLDEQTAERIQNINNGQGNSHLNKKDILAKYKQPAPKQEDQPNKSQELDRGI